MLKSSKVKTNSNVPKINNPGDSYYFKEHETSHRLVVEWNSKISGSICDLDLTVCCFDERGRFVEKLGGPGGVESTLDDACILSADVGDISAEYVECLKIDFDKIKFGTSAILLYLDGGPRNFQFVQNVSVKCLQIAVEQKGSFLPSDSDGVKTDALFSLIGKTKRDYQGLALCVLYKDGWQDDSDKPQWIAKTFLEPIYATTSKLKDEKGQALVVNVVPSLEKFKPRLFNNVRDICASLSSSTLKKLKKKFFENNGELSIVLFTEVLFNQLFETHPRIIEPMEAPYTVAMLQEMFHQIDYNGDGGADWDEFTSFCIQIAGSSLIGNSNNDNETLDEYVIEFCEDHLKRDRVLSPHRYVSLMRYVSEVKKYLVVVEGTDYVLVLDDKFNERAQLYPSKVQILGEIKPDNHNHDSKMTIYDCIYLDGRDMFALSGSDHAIVICKEQLTVGGNKMLGYIQHNKIYHNLLHLKLCWSKTSKMLCSVASNRCIYGWNIDTSTGATPIFQITRHSDTITDFITVDNLEVFITCSMDKRIVVWSANTRRVKGILIGHKRGVRCIDAYDTILLSAGFETEAKTWDLVSKEHIGILKGHRQPITSAVLMCERSDTEKDYRAVTVDEGGEFRLWSIFVKERNSGPKFVPTLQTFTMFNPEVPLNRFVFLAVPNDPKISTSYYSDIVACSTKLLHFIPEKNTKEFLPATNCVFNEFASTLSSLVGKSLLSYDMSTGDFVSHFTDLHHTELTSLCLDGARGRRAFIGCTNGDIILLALNGGIVVDSIHPHTKEVTCIVTRDGPRMHIYTGSLDGRINMLEENNGEMHVQNTIEHAFGVGNSVNCLKHAPSLKIIIASSTGQLWGIWHDQTLKNLILVEECNVISAIEIIGASRDSFDEESKKKMKLKGASRNFIEKRGKEQLLTLAVAIASSVRIYTIDSVDFRGVCSYELVHGNPLYITNMVFMKSKDDEEFVNYAITKVSKSRVIGYCLICTGDDGNSVTWDINGIREKSEDGFRKIAHRLPAITKKIPRKSNIIFDVNQYSTFEEHMKVEISTSNTTESDSEDTVLPDINKKRERKSRKKTIAIDTEEEIKQVAEYIHQSGEPLSPVRNHDNYIVSRPTSPGDAILDSIHNSRPTSPNPHKKNNSVGITNQFISDSIFFPLDGKINPNKVMSNRSWLCHHDSITSAVAMDESACFVTVSHDGFYRLWNIEEDCLGELVLPNITEKMKTPEFKIVDLMGSWKFILEKLPVSQAHKDFAFILVNNLKKSLELENDDSVTSSVRRKLVSTKDLITFQADNYESVVVEDDTEQTLLRNHALESLNETSVAFDDTAYPDGTEDYDDEFLKLYNKLIVRKDAETRKFADCGDLNTINESYLFQKSGIIPQSPIKLPGIKDTDSTSSSTFFTELGADGESVKSENTTSSKKPKKIIKKELWSTPESFTGAKYSVPDAFSEASLSNARYNGLIDNEGVQILKSISKQPSKLALYNRSTSKILLRSPSLSSIVEVPKSGLLKRSEVSFGNQKDMYKHASKILSDSVGKNQAIMRHKITMARIDSNCRNVNHMVHVINPPTIDEMSLDLEPAAGITKYSKSEEFQRNIRLMQSAIMVPEDLSLRDLDKDGISTIIGKMDDITKTPDIHYTEVDRERLKKMKKKKKEKLSPAAINIIEDKVKNAIKDAHRAEYVKKISRDDEVKPFIKKKLTTRQLLPYYTLNEVRHFLDIFAKVDEDFSGDLNINEWVHLFQSLNASVPVQEARIIFLKIDKDNDGYLTLKELIPVVFSKATNFQQKLIAQFTENELIKKSEGIITLSSFDLDLLFESYDLNSVGFVEIGFIRERIRGLNLQENQQFHFMENLIGIEDDDMVNLQEFSRIFTPYMEI
jgi:WD40 repeat protein/Ca2+-binding EF-hand superfamily protein